MSSTILDLSPEIIDENNLKCPFCDGLHKIQLALCPTHRQSLGFPNVNICNTPNQNQALEKRYSDAFEYARQHKYEDKLIEFEKVVQEQAVLTVNIKYEYLYMWLTESDFIYKTYYKLVREDKRIPMDLPDEGRRAAIDTKLYGYFNAEELGFAAISLDGVGVLNYGHFSVSLVTNSICKRTSLIEENSWKFADTHKLSLSENPPLGYRTVWNKRQQLAVAKCYKLVEAVTGANEFPLLVLKQGSCKMDDEYIEGHIYGGLTQNNIEIVRGNEDDLLKDSEDYIPKENDRKEKYAELTRSKIINSGKWQANKA